MGLASSAPTNIDLARRWLLAEGDSFQPETIEAVSQLYDYYESVKHISSETIEKLEHVTRKILERESVTLEQPSRYCRLIEQLKIREVSFHYRMRINGAGSSAGQENSEIEQMGNTLRLLSQAWYDEQQLKSYRHVNGDLVPVKELAPHQLESLQEVLNYPEFCKLIIYNTDLRIDFLKWALIDGCPVAPYIEFFGTCQNILKKSFLHKRIGYFRDDNPLKIKVKTKGEAIYKRLTLPFENSNGIVKERSILNLDKKVTFSFGLEATKREVFREFSEKKERPGRFEAFQGCVLRNWDYFNGRSNNFLGGYDSFELDTADWFLRLPVFETFTEAQMRARFQVTGPLSPTQWVTVVSANQIAPNMDIAETHGLLMILIPIGGGNYQLYPFTFLSPEFTTGCAHRSVIDILLKILRLGKTERGLWAYPDETVFYSNRQQAYFPVVIDSETGLRIMELLRQYFLKARAGNDPFQISYKNCAGSIQLFLRNIFPREVVPDLFDADILESDPRPPLRGFFSNIRQRPNWQVKAVIWFFGFTLLAWKGIFIENNGQREYVCMMRTPIFGPRLIFHAAKLAQRILNKEISGTIAFTHTPKSYDKNVISE